jgi:CheY-like chemotaxis protein
LAPKPLDANVLVTGMADLLRRALGETIEIETLLGTDLWLIESDQNQLESAILNLVLNSRDAMVAGGKLTIETQNVDVGPTGSKATSPLTEGQYVLICVSDTGRGMDAHTLAHAFEPFFTTKDVGAGTGLGLSQVYGFVQQSHGHVKMYSEPDEGTTVRVYLPRLIGGAVESALTSSIQQSRKTGTETVLVVEDDEEVRSFNVEVLRELGYCVLEAADGRSALRLIEDQGAAIQLLFTDVILPGGMNGAVLAEKAVELQPRLRVLFSSGHSRNALVHHGRLDPGVELISKPFTTEDLSMRLRGVLDRKAS